MLQFADYEGDEGKELLIKRYIDEQQPKDSDPVQPQQSFGSQYHTQTSGMALSQPRLDLIGKGTEVTGYDPQDRQANQQGSTIDRPKAAIVTRRHQKNVTLSKDVTFEDEEDEPSGRKRGEESRSTVKMSKSTRRSESESDGETRRKEKDEEGQGNQRKRGKEYDRRQAKSPTPPTEDDSRRSRSPSRSRRIDKRVSKSPSRSKTRSESPNRYTSKSKSPSRSKSRTRSRSISPPAPVSDREKRRAKGKHQQGIEKEGKHQRLKRHQPIQQHPSKGSREDNERDRGNTKEHRSHHHHHKDRVKHRDSRQQQSFKDSREELSREKSKSLEPSLTSLPLSINETELPGGMEETSKEATKTSSEAVLIESTTDVREQSPPSVDSGSRRERRRSSVFRQSSEDATQMQSMVDINIIPPSSAMTDSSYNPRDADGMMSDGAPPTPDADRDSGAQQPETTISATEKDGIDYGEGLDGDDEETGAVTVEAAESQSPERKPRTDEDDEDNNAATAGGERNMSERMDTIPEPEKLENETIASQSTLDIAEAEAAAAAVAPNDSVENPPPGDEGEPDRSLDKKGPDEDDDSGIGMVGYLSRRNKMLEKKSVFTIAYDEVAQSTMMRPDTRGSTGETENEIPTAVK